MTDWEGPEPPPPATGAREGKGGRVVVWTIVGLGALLAAAYAAAAGFAGDRVPRGTSIAGVDVGGLHPAQAETTLRERLDPRAERQIQVVVDGRDGLVDPAEAGLSIDYAASIARAGGERGWSPARLWDYYTGGRDLEAVVDTDATAMARALRGLTREFGTPARNAGVSFAGTDVATTPAVTGRAVEFDQGAAALAAAYLAPDPTAELTLVETEAEVSDAEAQQFVEEFANPALAAPVTLRFGRSPVVLRPGDYTRTLRVVVRDGALAARVDKAALQTLVEDRVSGDGAPVDATVELVAGAPRIVPAKPGVTFKPRDVVAAFLEVVAAPTGERTAEVPSTVAEPDFTTRDAKALKITEQVSTFTTYYPYAAYRNVNIPRAAELVNGTVLKPGDTFSLNDTVGERTRANGFTEGFIISNGIFKEDLGGGVSQMATTTFNAAFFAGMTDIEHKPHSFYIDRYPVGREATVAWGAVDLRFRNDTPYGVLVDAHVTPATPSASGVVTVSMWSTKYWDITTKTGDRYNLTPPQTRTLDTADCYPNTGYGGFDIDIWRYWRRAGSSDLERTEKMHTHYIPSDTVICTNPAAG